MSIMFTKEFIEELKNSVDMVLLAKENTDLKKVGKNIWQGKCPSPYHNDSTPSFTVWENSNRWTCFGCKDGKSYDCIDFVMWLHQLSFSDSIQYLAAKYNIPIPDSALSKEYENINKECNKYIKNINKKTINYLEKRGLDKNDIKKYKIGYDKDNDRIVFPLLDISNRPVGFIKRIFEDGSGPKYKNSCTSEIFNKSKYLYNLNNIDKTFNQIRITEGTMDSIMATKYGAKNVVSTLGTAITQNHVDIIKKLKMTPVIIYDSDDAGVSAANKALKLFYNNDICCKICPIKTNKDLCDLSNEIKFDIEDYIEKNSMTYGFAMVKDIIEAYNKDIYEIKLKYSKKINNIIDKIPQGEKDSINSFFKEEISLPRNKII